MEASAEGKRKSSSVNAQAQTVLRALERKRFFDHRFLAQVQALYGQTESNPVASASVAASLYLASMFERMPAELQARISATVVARLVNDFSESPTPGEFRVVMLEALLGALKLTPAGLVDRAGLFFACPPENQAIADRWVERVIYTTVKRHGREWFAFVTPDEWTCGLIETVFGEQSTLEAYRVKVEPPLPVVKRDWRSLVSCHG
jgi:hypothetical protein